MQTAVGSLGRVIAMRFEPGREVLSSLTEVCRENGLNNGMLLGGIGSLAKAVFCNPEEKADEKSGYGYGAPIILDGAIELISMSGMICQGDKGEILLHVHAAFSDKEGNGHSGHLLEGNIVLKTIDVVIAELKGIHMGRRFDDYLNAYIFNPSQE
jgi:predicted DNA-binding protein with PD1-like motif